MTTPRTHSIVSLAAGVSVTLALGACAPSRPAMDGPAPVEGRSGAIVFDNDGLEPVRVYLVGERREWLLGRVEPGSVATLQFPAASFGESSRPVRLAVIAGEGLTLRAAGDARATFTIAQPATTILSRRWVFAQGQLTPLGLRQ